MAGFLDRTTAGEIVARWKAMSPSVRREAIEVLFSRPEGIETLLTAIESRTLVASEIDLARLHLLQTHSNPAIRDRMWRIVDSGALPSRDRAAIVAAFRPALKIAGNRERGREVFVRPARHATKRKAVGSKSVRTWRPSKTDLARTCFCTSLIRTGKSRQIL